jgi:transcriptional/translational regulatory protein YebC/TACO1
LDKLNINYQSADITYIPENTVLIEDKERLENILKLAEALEEHDDVQKVHMNFVVVDNLVQ